MGIGSSSLAGNVEDLAGSREILHSLTGIRVTVVLAAVLPLTRGKSSLPVSPTAAIRLLSA